MLIDFLTAPKRANLTCAYLMLAKIFIHIEAEGAFHPHGQ